MGKCRVILYRHFNILGEDHSSEMSLKRYRDYGAGGNMFGGFAKRRRVMVSAAQGAQAPLLVAVNRAAGGRRAAYATPGFYRRAGNYGRYGAVARRLGNLPEKKFFDTALSFLFDATAEVPATGQLTLIPQGDTESTRDGRKAMIKSIQIRGNVLYNPAAVTTGCDDVFVYVILDTQCNGAAATVADVFTGTNLSTALLNLNNSGRFRILKKLKIHLAANAGVQGAFAAAIQQVEYFKTCNIPVDWSSTTGAITEIRSNNIFLIAGSSTLSDDLATFTGNCRLRFMG